MEYLKEGNVLFLNEKPVSVALVKVFQKGSFIENYNIFVKVCFSFVSP